MNNKKLIVQDVVKTFQGKATIENINFHICEGEIVALLGRSGVGKTTLFNIIAGIFPCDSGSVFLNKKNITGKSGLVSYMLQKDLLLPYKTIEENIALPLIIKGVKKQQAIESVSEYFKSFSLDGYQKKYPKQLSGGMRQRAALLRTYMFSKDLCLLDEPFSALDAFTKSNMHNWFLGLMSKINLTTLFITHDIDEAILISDRILIMNGSPGKITQEITIVENRPRTFEFTTSQEFISYKKSIINTLND